MNIRDICHLNWEKNMRNENDKEFSQIKKKKFFLKNAFYKPTNLMIPPKIFHPKSVTDPFPQNLA